MHYSRPMAHDDALDFLRQHGRSVLATYRPDGSAQLSPVLATVDAGDRVVVSTTGTTVKVRNLERDPRASLCVLNEHFFGEWHALEGTVEIVRLPLAMEPLVDYYRRAVGEHPDWTDYRAAMERDHRVLLQMTVQRSGPRQQG